MAELADILASGDIPIIKKGGVTDGREVQTLEELQTALSNGSVTSIYKGGVDAGDEVLSSDELDVKFPEPLHFAGNSKQTINISTDVNVTSKFPMDNDFVGHECELYNATNGEVINLSGRTIEVATGTVSFTPEKTGVGTVVFYLVSERSTDGGVTWTPNSESLRRFEFNRDQNQFSTKLSMVFDWLPNEILRFKAYASSTFSLVSPTETIDGDIYEGYSFFWSLVEVR